MTDKDTIPIPLISGGQPKPQRTKKRPRCPPVPPKAQWETIEVAAAKLDLDPQALRARCRRGARKRDKEIVAELGMGVVAKKLGKSWRVFVPDAPTRAQ